MEFPQIDEVEELAQALDESTLSSTDLSTSTGGRELKWWKLFKELNPFVHTSKGNSWWRKSSKRCNILVCDVCEEQICSVWLRCTYWGQIFCKRHTSDGTPQCCSCSRFKIGDIKYNHLSLFPSRACLVLEFARVCAHYVWTWFMLEFLCQYQNKLHLDQQIRRWILLPF
nr:uncharacterized protein LOC104118268 [Nicotiana tomentosiformis]